MHSTCIIVKLDTDINEQISGHSSGWGMVIINVHTCTCTCNNNSLHMHNYTEHSNDSIIMQIN